MNAVITLSAFFFLLNKPSNKEKEPMVTLKKTTVFFCLFFCGRKCVNFAPPFFLLPLVNDLGQASSLENQGFSHKQVCTTRTVGWLAADRQTDKLPPCKNIPVSTLNLTYKNNNNKKTYKNQSLFKSPLRKDESTTKELSEPEM